MMAVMTMQPPLPLAPQDARPIGTAAAIVEDDNGGRVFVHGNLAYAWDCGDAVARRFAAVSLVRIKAATQLEVAEAFAVKPATVRRWETWLTDSGVVGLLGERKGPKRKSKLTAEAVARIQRLRDGGASYRAIAAETGVSEGSVRNAIVLADDGARAEEACPATTSDVPPGPEPEVEKDCSAAVSDDLSGQVPVLADPVDRGAERVLARFGLVASAPPVFTGCARAPLAGLLLALPALAGTGLIEDAHAVYGGLPNGFYSLDTMLCESVFRALLGEARAQGAARIDPPALGRVLGLDRAPEVKTIRRKIKYLAEAEKAGDWIAAMAARHVQARPEQAAVLYVDGHVRAYQGTRKIAKTHVPRLKFPAPATLETWVADAVGDPLLVVMAEPGASLAAELRRLIPQLRGMVGDDRRVLVGFDRGGWSATLFADLHAAGFDTLTWRKGRIADVEVHSPIRQLSTDLSSSPDM
jgi:prepilin-type processing-associated H-X9-DG protein